MVILVRADFTRYYPKVSYGISSFFSTFHSRKQYEGISLVPTPFYQADDMQVIMLIALSIIFCFLAITLSLIAINKRQHTSLAAAGAFVAVLAMAEVNIYLSLSAALITIYLIFFVQKRLKHAV
mgnify:FL=1